MASDKDVQYYITSWLAAVRDEANDRWNNLQRKFIDFLTDLDGPQHRQELGKIATAAAKTKAGLVVRYGYHAVDFYEQQHDDKYHDYLFHGTNATWEILDSGKLKQSDAGHGTGIYFGRDYHTSVPYMERKGQHKTDKHAFIRSILIFRNNSPPGLVARDWDAGPFEYYLPDVPEYKIDTLVAIVFHGREDVVKFDEQFQYEWSEERKKAFLERKIKLYDHSLRPLDYDTVFEEFSRVFKSIPQVLDVDQELAFWPVGHRVFHLRTRYLYGMLLNSTKGDRDLVKRVVRSALWDREYTFIQHEVKRKLTDEEWLDLIMMGKDGGYKEDLQYTLLWLMIKEDSVDKYEFPYLIQVKTGKERLQEWRKNNQWVFDNENKYGRSSIRNDKWHILKDG
jgi:hypothetical protein